MTRTLERDEATEQLLRSLLDSCGRGNQSALAALYDRTVCGALAVARCVAADEPAAQQATHDAYVEIWDRARAGRVPDQDVATWILAVTHRHARVA